MQFALASQRILDPRRATVALAVVLVLHPTSAKPADTSPVRLGAVRAAVDRALEGSAEDFRLVFLLDPRLAHDPAKRAKVEREFERMLALLNAEETVAESSSDSCGGKAHLPNGSSVRLDRTVRANARLYCRLVPFFDRHSFDCNQRAILHLATALRLGISPPAYARSLDHAGLIFEDQGLVLDPSDGDLRSLLDFARARGKHPDRGEGYFLRTPRHHYLIVEDRGAVALRAVTLSEQPDLVAPLEPLASLLLDAASGASDAGTARSYAELALVLDPGNADAHDTLGNLAADLEPVLAAAEYEAALALDPHSARVHYNLGVLLHSQGETAAAAAEYRAALVLQPTLIAATENLAGLLAIRSGGPAPSQRGTTTFPAFPLP